MRYACSIYQWDLYSFLFITGAPENSKGYITDKLVISLLPALTGIRGRAGNNFYLPFGQCTALETVFIRVAKYNLSFFSSRIIEFVCRQRVYRGGGMSSVRGLIGPGWAVSGIPRLVVVLQMGRATEHIPCSKPSTTSSTRFRTGRPRKHALASTSARATYHHASAFNDRFRGIGAHCNA